MLSNDEKASILGGQLVKFAFSKSNCVKTLILDSRFIINKWSGLNSFSFHCYALHRHS